MPIRALIAASVLLTPPGTPAGGFHWQRIITPPPGAGTEQACVVLDAATFANAGVALRDLRLFQDGTELPYVIEESYDERALNSGVTPDDDRSEYEPVLIMPLRERPYPGALESDLRRNTLSLQPLKPGEIDPWNGTSNELELPRRVPVERIRFEPAPTSPASVSVVGTQRGPANSKPLKEIIQGTVNAQHPAFPVTIGANLQQAAKIFLAIDNSHQVFTRAILEMRKRSLCYQPRSASPLVLYLGGGQGIAAKTYGLANGFSVSANRPYATMGPLEPNPDLEHPPRHPVSRLLIAIAALGLTLLLTLWIGLELMRKEKGRPKAAQS